MLLSQIIVDPHFEKGSYFLEVKLTIISNLGELWSNSKKIKKIQAHSTILYSFKINISLRSKLWMKCKTLLVTQIN